MKMADKPLAGIRVIELCNWVSGPMTTSILADQGADVLKVEAPGGDPMRMTGTSRNGFSAMFLSINRNKKSISLNLKRAEDRSILLEQVATADVFVQNSRAGAMARLGLDPESMRSLNPRLIYASITGFGNSGPLATAGAFDPLIQAMSGIAVIQGSADAPRLDRTMIPDKLMGPVMAQAITAALFQRERSGAGCTLDCSMLDATIWWMWPDGMMNETFVGDGVRRGADISEADPICPTADGFLAVSPQQEKDWLAFTEAVGRLDLRDDPRLATASDRMRNLATFSSALRESLGGRTTQEWFSILSARDVPCAPVLSPAQVLRDSQVSCNGIVEEVDHPRAGRYRTARAPVQFDGAFYGAVAFAPDVGEHAAA